MKVRSFADFQKECLGLFVLKVACKHQQKIRIEMPPTWIALIYLICALLNILQIYQICEEYLRYEATTNAQIVIPEKIELPSMTLCVDIPPIFKWDKMSPKLEKKLNKTRNMIGMQQLSYVALSEIGRSHHLVAYGPSYDEMVKEIAIPELLNITRTFEEIFDFFEANNLELSNMTKLQFSFDKIFLHAGYKCFSLSLLTNGNNIVDFIDIQSRVNSFLFWGTSSGAIVAFFFHKKDYLVSLVDEYIRCYVGYSCTFQFVIYESIRLEYPYKSNCRDYTKVGLLSRKECIEKCFKNKTVTKFGYVFFQSHAFHFDDLHLGIQGDTNYTHDIFQECKLHCKQIECHSITYDYELLSSRNLVNFLGQTCSYSTGPICPEGEIDLRKLSSLSINEAPLPFTRTESQPAIPLITFVTGVLSTFGFWLGLSVSDSFHVFKNVWNKVQVARDKTR